MTGKKVCLLFFTLLFLSFGSATLLRAESGATALVKSVLDKAMDIQTRPDIQGTEHRSERSVLTRKLIADNFLSAEMAKESLRDHWDKLSASQRQQYQELFIGLFQDSYTRRVLNFLKRETVEYPGEVPEGKFVKVRTIIMRTNEHIPVDYIVDQKNQKWYIRDMIIDDVSTVETYRSAFDRMIGTHSFEELIKRMILQKKAGEDV